MQAVGGSQELRHLAAKLVGEWAVAAVVRTEGFVGNMADRNS